jgi:hypothetical protein
MQRGLVYGHWQFAKDDDGIRRIINGGLAEKGMPGFGAALSPNQITVLLRYIRENQSSGPEPVPRTGKPSGFE